MSPHAASAHTVSSFFGLCFCRVWYTTGARDPTPPAPTTQSGSHYHTVEHALAATSINLQSHYAASRQQQPSTSVWLFAPLRFRLMSTTSHLMCTFAPSTVSGLLTSANLIRVWALRCRVESGGLLRPTFHRLALPQYLYKSFLSSTNATFRWPRRGEPPDLQIFFTRSSKFCSSLIAPLLARGRHQFPDILSPFDVKCQVTHSLRSRESLSRIRIFFTFSFPTRLLIAPAAPANLPADFGLGAAR
ncbi:hypothetical protein K438DRAFT_1767934 [Mycena galopus ATCC 62051]|nr:hypothetical protein K438DRAFT_1767934 [Mycena galopus ATCC 62051]